MEFAFSHTVSEPQKYENSIIDTKCNNGEQIYTDLNDWMNTRYPVIDPGKLTELAHKLQDLYGKRCSVLGQGVTESSLSRLPYSKYQYQAPALAARFLR